jgi:hypothetical protein
MQIRNTTGSYSVADRNPDMMEPKDPASVKIINTKGQRRIILDEAT